MPHGVIFDVDGVLVDSYQAHFQSWLDLARESGLSLTADQFAGTFGRTSVDIIRRFWPPERLRDSLIRELDDRKEALYRELVAADFPVMDGAIGLIDELHRDGFLLAVGSSGPPANVDLALARLGRRGVFGAVVTGVDVKRGKPDPEVFQMAAARLGVEPHRCAVLEDAPAGIEAAHRAGMVAVGLTSTGRTAEELQEADLVIGSLRELNAARLRDLIDR